MSLFTAKPAPPEQTQEWSRCEACRRLGSYAPNGEGFSRGVTLEPAEVPTVSGAFLCVDRADCRRHWDSGE